jgi:hypothetical protein
VFWKIKDIVDELKAMVEKETLWGQRESQRVKIRIRA